MFISLKRVVLVFLILFWLVVGTVLISSLFYDGNSLLGSDLTESGFEGNIVLNIEEIAKHSTSEDCLLLVDGKVYAVSSYISSHPGGSGRIISNCGKDATDAFGSVGHSSFAQGLLAGYYIGDLGAVATLPNEPPPTPDQPYVDAVLKEYPDAESVSVRLEDSGKGEIKFRINGKLCEGKISSKFKITKVEC